VTWGAFLKGVAAVNGDEEDCGQRFDALAAYLPAVSLDGPLPDPSWADEVMIEVLQMGPER